MCGRYYINPEMFKELRQIIHFVQTDPMLYGDIFPSQKTLILAEQEGKLTPFYARWGIPGKEKTSLIINARAESLRDRPMFRENFSKRRCLVPASGFYEWNSQKEKITFSQTSCNVMFMAGIYGKYNNQDTFAIITTQANASVASTHNRMPLIIKQEDIPDWIHSSQRSSQLLNSIPPLLEHTAEYEQQTLQFYL